LFTLQFAAATRLILRVEGEEKLMRRLEESVVTKENDLTLPREILERI
jgi:hypothetical protein